MKNEPSKAAMRKAVQLATTESRYHPAPDYEPTMLALARLIQEHSDVAKKIVENWTFGSQIHEDLAALQSLILPDEKPDPLVEARPQDRRG